MEILLLRQVHYGLICVVPILDATALVCLGNSSEEPCVYKEIKVFLKLGRTECYLVSTLLQSIISLKFSIVWCECVDMTCVGQHLNDICKAEWQSKIFKTHVVF